MARVDLRTLLNQTHINKLRRDMLDRGRTVELVDPSMKVLYSARHEKQGSNKALLPKSYSEALQCSVWGAPLPRKEVTRREKQGTSTS